MHVLVFYHVEDVARNQQMIEAVQVVEAEEVYQEQQSQEIEVADQFEEPALDSNCATSDLQQGKHQINSTQCLTYFEFMQLLIPVHLS